MARRDKNIAKNEIYGAFREFIESGKSKVTVSSIIDATGLNRKTFYNHFANQDELVAWGFRRDLLDVLLEHREIGDLVEPPDDPYEFEGLPCYYRTPSSTLSLDQSAFFADCRSVFRIHPDYYKSLFRTDLAPAFYQYLTDVLKGLFYEDVGYFLNGRKMPDEARRYIAAYYAGGVGYAVRRASESFTLWDEIAEVSPINNMVHEGMLHIVEAYQSEKSTLYFRSARPS